MVFPWQILPILFKLMRQCFFFKLLDFVQSCTQGQRAPCAVWPELSITQLEGSEVQGYLQEQAHKSNA